MSPAPTVSLTRDRLTWWSYAVLASYALVLNAFGPVLDDLRDELDVSRTVIGLHSTALAAGTLLAGVIGEPLRDRLGWLRLYWLATAGLLAGVLALAAAGAPAVSLSAAVLIGAAGSFIVVMVPALLNAGHGAAAGAALSEAHATASLLGMLAPLAVGVSLAALDMWLPALLVVTLGLLPALGARAPAFPPDRPAPAGTPALGRLPGAYWRWWLALTFAIAAEFSVLLWAVDDAQERLGLGVAASALAPSGFLLGMGVARGLGARLLLRHPPVRVFRAAAGLAAAGFLLYHATAVAPLAVTGLVVVGLGVGLLYPTALTAAMAAAPGLEARASTRSALASGLAIGLGPLLLGTLADASSVGTASWVVPVMLAAAMVAARPVALRR